MPTAQGIGSALAFSVKETTYGTLVAPTRAVPMLGESLTKPKPTIDAKTLKGGNRLETSSSYRFGIGGGSGDTNMFLFASGATFLWEAMLGTQATTGAGPYCVDEDTEILTGEGWKTVHDLRSGNEVLTLNHDSGMSEWQPVSEVCVFPAERRELVHMEGKSHSSLTTPNHRWPTKTIFGGRTWRTTETLRPTDGIPIAATCADLPTETKYSDAFVELVAWFWTEGTIRNTNGVRICQAVHNEVNVDRIDACLRGAFGPPVDLLGSRDPLPRWRRYVDNDGRNTRFSLNATAGSLLVQVAPNRVPDIGFIRSLTAAQLELFISVSMLADNCGPTRLAQKNPAASEAFQVACILSGRASSLRKRSDQDMWVVTQRHQRSVSPVNAAAKNAQFRIERVEHDGLVWCPRTPNQTWLARRKGTVYFTGNTHTASAGATLPSYSIDVNIGGVAAGDLRKTVLGAKVDSWELKAAVDENVTLSQTWVYQSETVPTGAIRGTYGAAMRPFVAQEVVLSGSGAPVGCVQQITISGNNNLLKDQKCLGSAVITEPVPNDELVITGSMDVLLTAGSTANYGVFTAGTEVALIVTMTSAVTAGATCTITMNVRIEGTTPTVPGTGVISVPIPFTVIAPTTDASGFQVVTVNGDAVA